MPRFKWIKVVDANAHCLDVCSVMVYDDDVASLLQAAHSTVAGLYFQGIVPQNLPVFPSRAALDANDFLARAASVATMGESFGDPLIIQLPPYVVATDQWRMPRLVNAAELTAECRDVRSWTTGVAHAIPHIHAFMKPLGGCTDHGQVFWREEERQIVRILLSDWADRRGKQGILMGSPCVGQSVKLRLVALHLALVDRANSPRRVFTTTANAWGDAMAIYRALETKFSCVLLLIDGFEYHDLPDDCKMAFDLLATCVPAETDDALVCLFPSWRRNDLFGLGASIYDWDEDVMTERFYYSGGCVREFTRHSFHELSITMGNAAYRAVQGGRLEILSRSTPIALRGYMDELMRRVVLPRDRVHDSRAYQDPDAWEHVVDSAYDDALADALLKLRIHKHAASGTLALYSTPYDGPRQTFARLPLVRHYMLWPRAPERNLRTMQLENGRMAYLYVTIAHTHGVDAYHLKQMNGALREPHRPLYVVVCRSQAAAQAIGLVPQGAIQRAAMVCDLHVGYYREEASGGE